MRRREFGLAMLAAPAADILLNRSAPPWLSMSGAEEMFPKSGDAQFDFALAHSLSAMSARET